MGQQIYFIHECLPRPDAIPLMLIHGWPGSIFEFEKLIGPLTHPKDPNSPAFDVIIPSLPGFGYSGPTTTRGWGPQRIAKALVVLMDRLGYSKFGIQGGDWGSAVAQDMAYPGAHARDRVASESDLHATAEPGSRCENERC